MKPQAIIGRIQQDRRIQIAILAVVVLFIVGLVFAVTRGGGETKIPGNEQIKIDQRELATVNNVGRAIEIQAMLARQGIHLVQVVEGEKITLKFEETAKQMERDKALITLVQ